jgi:NADH-quinone oxidoreductase subunit J
LFASVLFFAVAAVLVGAALGVVLSRNPVHSALCLVLAFFASAVIWLLLEAEFLAIVLVLVYVGAVMVLFLFVVMMLDVNLEELRRGIAGYWPLAAAVLGFLVFAMLNVIIAKHLGGAALKTAAPRPEGYSDAAALGTVLFTRYAYAAQLAAVILLIASIAAIVLTLRRRPGLKSLNVSHQVSVRSADRVRIVGVSSEKKP